MREDIIIVTGASRGIGAAIALLVWMYLLSLIALLGCAYNAEMERLKKEGVIS